MRSWLPALFHSRSSRRARRPAASVRLRLEALEERLTPALTYHGGAILTSVQAQSLYLGAGWNNLTTQTSQFDAFLSTLVSGTTTSPSAYLAMLHKAPFTGVTGAGSALTGATDSTDLVAATSTQTVYDSQIQSDLAAEIQAGAVQQPNANALYVVYVEPNVVVSFPNGQNSVNTFLAYHSSFSDNGTAVRYAVVPYHGSGGNAQDPWLTSAFDSMTVAASHETAEAITDPDGTAYFDRSGNEVGDVVNGSTVYIHDSTGANQYAVQREGSIPASITNFLPMTPAGATAGHTDTFGGVGGPQLTVNGVAVADPSGETGKVAFISPPSIDDFGQPMVDVVFSDGKAYEYHDFPAGNPTATANPSFFPWTSLGSKVKQAVSGQAVSYVLFTNGNLEEYVDPNYSTYFYGYGVNPGSHRGVIASGVTAITGVGLDQVGVNAVTYTKTVSGATVNFEWRDVTGSAVQISGASPFSPIKHSELPVAFGGNAVVVVPSPTGGATPSPTGGATPSPTGGATPSPTGGATPSPTTVDLVFLSALSGASSAASAQPSQSAALTPTPAVLSLSGPTPQPALHVALPDGGGGGVPEGQPADSAARGQDAPTSLADVPLIGTLFTEAVRRLQGARFALPAEMWPAGPAPQDGAPAPTKGHPQAPQSKATIHVPWTQLGAYVLPVAVGLCGAGVDHEVRRRRERLLKKSR